jgi:hypothetical protein
MHVDLFLKVTAPELIRGSFWQQEIFEKAAVKVEKSKIC